MNNVPPRKTNVRCPGHAMWSRHNEQTSRSRQEENLRSVSLCTRVQLHAHTERSAARMPINQPPPLPAPVVHWVAVHCNTIYIACSTKKQKKESRKAFQIVPGFRVVFCVLLFFLFRFFSFLLTKSKNSKHTRRLQIIGRKWLTHDGVFSITRERGTVTIVDVREGVVVHCRIGCCGRATKKYKARKYTRADSNQERQNNQERQKQFY